MKYLYKTVLFLSLFTIAVNSRANEQRVVAFLDANTDSGGIRSLQKLRGHLEGQGLVEGKNVVFVARFANNQLGKLPSLARELLLLKPNVIVAVSQAAARAAKEVTSEVPIVFHSSGDPIASGLVSDLGRPGGNVTGFYQFLDLDARLCQIAFDAFPSAKKVGFLYDSTEKSQPNFDEIRKIEKSSKREVVPLPVSSFDHFRGLAEGIKHKGVQVVVVPMMFAFFKQPKDFVSEFARLGIPAIYERTSYAKLGGLMSYGPIVDEAWQEMAGTVSKILRGVPVAQIPVQRPKRFELALNVSVAEKLGITFPTEFISRVDLFVNTEQGP